MKRWTPAPSDLIREADRTRWTKERPAPAIVGYVIVWDVLRDGGTWSSRQLAEHLGWSRYSAKAMLKRVEDELVDWRARFDPEQGGKPDNEENSTDFSHNSPDFDHKTPKFGHQLRVLSGGYEPTSSDTSTELKPDTRARITTDTDTEKTTDTNNGGPAPPARRSSVPIKDTWNKVEILRIEHIPGCKAQKLTKGRRKVLRARIVEHSPDAVVEVWRWALTSKNTRAMYLREHGYVRPDTLHRPSKFAGYLEMANEEKHKKTRTETKLAVQDLDAFLADT